MEKARNQYPYYPQLREAHKLEREEICRKWNKGLRAEKVRSKMGAEVRIVAAMAMLLVVWAVAGNQPAFFVLAASVMAVTLVRSFANLSRKGKQIHVRQELVTQGKFRVLEAVAEGVVRGKNGAYCAQVRRIDPQIGGPCPIPLTLSKQVRENGSAVFPVLLVQLEGEETIYAIPRLP